MSRLFITPREIDFISDLTKEITKDVIGQKIFYYHVREDLTDVHDVYEEAPDKIFDPPIEIEAFIDWVPEEVRTNRFGHEEFSSTEVRIQARDILDREIDLKEGDYFSYGVFVEFYWRHACWGHCKKHISFFVERFTVNISKLSFIHVSIVKFHFLFSF